MRKIALDLAPDGNDSEQQQPEFRVSSFNEKNIYLSQQKPNKGTR